MIAEEVEEIKPELVIIQGNGVKTVDYHYLFLCGLKELQKQKAEIDELKKQRAELDELRALVRAIIK